MDPKELNFQLAHLGINQADAAEGAATAAGTNLPQLTVGVSEARGEKCPRCWMHSQLANAEGLCPRCAAVIAKLDVEI